MKSLKLNSVILLITTLFLTVSTADAAKWILGKNGRLRPTNESSQPELSRDDRENRQSESIARTRKQILMLDDLYKTAVVLITEYYVNTPSTLSAATASKALFAAMKEKGWHEARLLGFTEVLFNPGDNAPQDQFEKTAKSKLLNSKATHEEVVTING